MTYLVMELHPAYAVLMDEEGRFLKAANLNYQIGDTVQDIVKLKEQNRYKMILPRSLGSLAAVAACFCLIFFGVYRPNYMPYGTVRIKINPDVILTVTRSDRVIGLMGLNPDGETLINGYIFKGKSKSAVADDLADRAIVMGFLTAGKEIRISVASRDTRWKETAQQDILDNMQEHLKDSAIIIKVDASLAQHDEHASASPVETNVQTLIPAPDQTPAQTQDQTQDQVVQTAPASETTAGYERDGDDGNGDERDDNGHDDDDRNDDNLDGDDHSNDDDRDDPGSNGRNDDGPDSDDRNDDDRNGNDINGHDSGQGSDEHERGTEDHDVLKDEDHDLDDDNQDNHVDDED